MRARLLLVTVGLLTSLSGAGIADAVAFTAASAPRPAHTASAAATAAKVAAVPEPHTWLLILSGLAVGAYLARRTPHE